MKENPRGIEWAGGKISRIPHMVMKLPEGDEGHVDNEKGVNAVGRILDRSKLPVVQSGPEQACQLAVVVIAKDIGTAWTHGIRLGIEQRPQAKDLLVQVQVMVGEIIIAAVDGILQDVGRQADRHDGDAGAAAGSKPPNLVGQLLTGALNARVAGGIFQGQLDFAQLLVGGPEKGFGPNGIEQVSRHAWRGTAGPGIGRKGTVDPSMKFRMDRAEGKKFDGQGPPFPAG